MGPDIPQVTADPPKPPTAEETIRKMDQHFQWLLDHPETIKLGLKPRSKARPRFFSPKGGGKGRTYMDPAYVLWQKRMGEIMDAAGGIELLGGPDNALTIVAEFGMKAGGKPKKWLERFLGELHTNQRGDIDNLIGAVMDALLDKENGGDGRVGWLNVRKVWATEWYIKIRPIFRAGR